jgi:hypothetical protein
MTCPSRINPDATDFADFSEFKKLRSYSSILVESAKSACLRGFRWLALLVIKIRLYLHARFLCYNIYFYHRRIYERR